MSKFQPTYIIGDVNSPRVKARSMTNANRSFYERARKTSMLANTEKKVFKSGVVFCQKAGCVPCAIMLGEAHQM